MIKTFKNILVFILTFALTLFLSDIFIKTAGITQMLIYKYDEHFGRVFVEKADYLMTIEGFALGRINNYGYVGPGYGKEKSPGKLRIALLGDSFTEGFQHFDRNHFRAVIENELKEKYGVDAEVMNFGRFAYNLLDMYAQKKTYVEDFHPDITLFLISNGKYTDSVTSIYLPSPALVNDELVITYPKIPGSRMPWYLNRVELSMVSPTVMMIRNCMTLIGKGQLANIMLGKFGALFTKVKTEEKNNGSIKPIPFPELNKRIYEDLANEKGNYIVYMDKQLPAQFIRDELLKTGINTIPLSEKLGSGKQNGSDIYFIDKLGQEGHWSINGNKIVGEYLAKWIAENAL